MRFEEEIKNLCRNSVRLDIGGEADLSAGLTRFGGRPVLPRDFEWPYFETDTFDDSEVKPRPLSFIAQFDCSEIAVYDTENLLPQKGILSFFYEMGSQRWGFDPEDKGCARVYWFEDTDNLVSTGFPDDLEEDYRFPALKIVATSKKSYPCYEDFDVDMVMDDWEEFEEAEKKLGIEAPDERSKLLGWPDIIQNNMTMECELVSRGYYCGNTWEEIPLSDRQAARESSFEEWRLLFQLDTVEHGDFELMFGDCGRIYFYIRKDDLAKRDFDRVQLVCQCY